MKKESPKSQERKAQTWGVSREGGGGGFCKEGVHRAVGNLSVCPGRAEADPGVIWSLRTFRREDGTEASCSRLKCERERERGFEGLREQ